MAPYPIASKLGMQNNNQPNFSIFCHFFDLKTIKNKLIVRACGKFRQETAAETQ